MRIRKRFWSALQTIISILLKRKHWLVSVPKSSNWTEKKKLQNSHGVFVSVIDGQSCYRFWLQKVIISIKLQEVQQSWTKAELNSVPSFQQCIKVTVHEIVCLGNEGKKKLNFPWYIVQLLLTKYLRTLWSKSFIQTTVFNRRQWDHPPKMYQAPFWIYLYLASTAPAGKGIHIVQNIHCTETQQFARVLQ